MEIVEWLNANGDIARTDQLYRAGFTKREIAELVQGGHARRFRRSWIVMLTAPRNNAIAAAVGGLVTCESLAEQRGWWLTTKPPVQVHLALPRRSGALPQLRGIRPHWSSALPAISRTHVVDSVENALRHIAQCLPFDQALPTWESAIRKEGLSPESLRMIRWHSTAATALAQAVTGLPDSGLDAILYNALRHIHVRMRWQWIVGGRRKDLLIGERLIVEADGHEFHSSSAARTRDTAHDNELRLRGYTTLRFTYYRLIHDLPSVIRQIEQAIAAGLHLAS